MQTLGKWIRFRAAIDRDSLIRKAISGRLARPSALNLISMKSERIES